jgi:hypothetical protein
VSFTPVETKGIVLPEHWPLVTPILTFVPFSNSLVPVANTYDLAIPGVPFASITCALSVVAHVEIEMTASTETENILTIAFFNRGPFPKFKLKALYDSKKTSSSSIKLLFVYSKQEV